MKYLVLLVIIATVSGGPVHNPVSESDFESLYNNLKSEIGKATKNGIEHIEPFYQAMVMAANSDLKKGLLELDALTRGVEGELDELVSKNPGDVEKCTKDNLKQIKNLEEETMYTTRKCIGTTVKAMETFYSKAFISLAEIHAIPSEYVIEYDLCDDDRCRGLVEKEITKEIDLIAGKVQKIVDIFRENMDLLVPGYEDSCVSSLRQQLRNSLRRIVDEIASCLQNL